MWNKDWFRHLVFVGVLVGIPLLAFVGVEAYHTVNKQLPVINPHDDEEGVHKIPEFSFTNQQGKTVELEGLKGKIFVANFFFTSCPSTCPPMMKQLERVQDSFSDNPNVRIISHTVDPKRDTVAALKEYAEKYRVKNGFWHLVTGDKKSLYLQFRRGYDVAALEGEDDSPAGFIHSSKLFLVDEKQRIRGYYNGTETEPVNQLIADLKFLLNKRKPS